MHLSGWIIIGLAVWIVVSVLVALLWGRIIRTGQHPDPDKHDPHCP